MPSYEFRCRACGSTFTIQRPMSASGDPATCPEGHEDTVRLLTTVGAVTRSARRGDSVGRSSPSGGACCGGGCCSQ